MISRQNRIECLSEEDLYAIENPRCDEIGDECPYDNAHIFLMGSCQFFSYVLHQKYGYKAYKIWKNTSCHWFCSEKIEGITYYMDVRGVTTDWDEFLRPFGGKTVIAGNCCEQNFEETETEIKEDPEGLRFAKWIVEQNPERYQI